MNQEKGSCEMKSGKSGNCCPGCGCSKENCCCKSGECGTSAGSCSSATVNSFKHYYKSFIRVMNSLIWFNGIGLIVAFAWSLQLDLKTQAAMIESLKHVTCMFSMGFGLAFGVILLDLLCMLRCFLKAHCKKSNCCPTSCMGCYFMFEYVLALGSAGTFAYGFYCLTKLMHLM